MSNVFNRITGKLLKSVNTPDFDPNIWIINPTDAEIAAYKEEAVDKPDLKAIQNKLSELTESELKKVEVFINEYTRDSL